MTIHVESKFEDAENYVCFKREFKDKRHNGVKFLRSIKKAGFKNVRITIEHSKDKK